MGNIAIVVDGKWVGNSDYNLAGHKVTHEITSDTDVAIVGTQMIGRRDIKDLKGVVRLGVGYNNIPLSFCIENDIKTAYTPNAPSQSVAEHTLALMMAALRMSADRKTPGRMLDEINVAIVGRGRIGKRFAALLSYLGVVPFVVDPVRDTTFDEIHRCINVDLTEALSIADVVTLHVPLESQTTGMIGSDELMSMKTNGVIINTSRGGIIDESALEAHLKIWPEFIAAIDVFNVEPYDGPLLYLKNCLCTPHVSSMTITARMKMEEQSIAAALCILDGRSPEWPIPEFEPWHNESNKKGA